MNTRFGANLLADGRTRFRLSASADD